MNILYEPLVGTEPWEWLDEFFSILFYLFFLPDFVFEEMPNFVLEEIKTIEEGKSSFILFLDGYIKILQSLTKFIMKNRSYQNGFPYYMRF